MAHSRQFLAIDLGAESGRATLGALEGGRLELAEVHRFPNGPVSLPGGLHWDVLRLWVEIKNGVAAAWSQAGADLCSLGLDTWGVDFALLDRRGELLGNPYHYRDSRTDGIVAEACRRFSREEIFNATGIQFMQLNTLYQLLSLVVRGSPLLEAAGRLLLMPDLFNFWLSGRAASEFTIATTTQCYDPRLRHWAWPLLEALGIPAHLFQEVIQPGTVLGPLQPGLQEELGVKNLQVVAPACHDTGSAVVAVPAEGERYAWISSGTWSIIGTEVGEPVINRQTLDYNFTNEGGAGGWRLSKNILGLWLVQECRRSWARLGQALSYDEITQLAFQAEPFQAVIDPDWDGFLKPGDMPGRVQACCRQTGQRAPETEGGIARCILESIALKYRWVLERLDALVGARLEPVHIFGGGAKNRLLSQFTANATGRAVVAGPFEATTIGNILMQAIALGELGSLQEARDVVRRSFTPELFLPQGSAGWDEAYSRLAGQLAPANPGLS
jgi:rhamnulokinase